MEGADQARRLPLRPKRPSWMFEGPFSESSGNCTPGAAWEGSSIMAIGPMPDTRICGVREVALAEPGSPATRKPSRS